MTKAEHMRYKRSMSKVEDLKIKVEEATARNFIEWYNKSTNRNFAFLHRPSPAPDFVYSDKDGEIGLEITTVYYDQNHAKATTETARGIRKSCSLQDIIGALRLDELDWVQVCEPEIKLITSINRQLTEKCEKDYGSDCILVVRVVSAGLTTESEFETEVIPQLRVPEKNRFLNIFITENQNVYFELA